MRRSATRRTCINSVRRKFSSLSNGICPMHIQQTRLILNTMTTSLQCGNVLRSGIRIGILVIRHQLKCIRGQLMHVQCGSIVCVIIYAQDHRRSPSRLSCRYRSFVRQRFRPLREENESTQELVCWLRVAERRIFCGWAPHFAKKLPTHSPWWSVILLGMLTSTLDST
jgi:hypothetical protein